jgi:hypothetical protein
MMGDAFYFKEKQDGAVADSKTHLYRVNRHYCGNDSLLLFGICSLGDSPSNIYTDPFT